MTRNSLVAALAIAGVWGEARADDAAAPVPTANAEISDEELAKLAAAETIEVYAERPDKPFDRDTEVRLTGEQLAKRGATDLATALALLGDVIVRDGGRGGFNIDIRGARKDAVSIFVDGVLVSDPFYGTFDLSSIPVTDIVQIRVATTPQSPIDGPGGSGGVVEVHTRDAIGPQIVVARVSGDSLPTFGVSGTARTALTKHLALRFSLTGFAGARDLDTPTASTVAEDRQAATGATRLEYRKGSRRLVLDTFLDNRHYISPPADDPSATLAILMIDRETTARASAVADDKIGTLQLQGQTWMNYLYRRSRNFRDAALTDQFGAEELTAMRFGARTLVTKPFAKDFRWAASASVDREQARVVDGDTSKGDILLTNLALDGQYEHGRVRVDLAGGVTLPLGVTGADPWPEAKLVGKYRPERDLELTATVGYKGTVPSLRERFDSAIGNPGLGPELARHAEIRAIWEGLRDESLGADERYGAKGTDAAPRVRLEVAPFTRKTKGTSRVCAAQDQCPDGMVGRNEALDDTFFYGVDVQARVKVVRAVEVGGSYGYIKVCELGSPRGCDVAATNPGGGADPLDRLPRHRGDGWVQVSPHRKVSAVARARFFGQAIDRRQRTERHTLLEATVTAEISKRYLAVMRVEDALDVRPETRANVHLPGRVVSFVFQGTWD